MVSVFVLGALPQLRDVSFADFTSICRVFPALLPLFRTEDEKLPGTMATFLVLSRTFATQSGPSQVLSVRVDKSRS